MNLRSKVILGAAIKEYIKTGMPVSSKELATKYDFGVRWASIRRELGNLTRSGFLAQLHTSGGRVPTDKGYRVFVEDTIDDVVDAKKILSEKNMLAENLRKGRLRDFVKDFSDEVKLLGVGKKEKDQEVYKSGLQDLFEHIEVDSRQEIREIVRDFELLDKRLEEMRSRLFRALEAPQVFIGRSPITKSRNLSVIADSYDIDGERIFIAVIGPKRMDYDKMIKLFRSFRNFLNE